MNDKEKIEFYDNLTASIRARFEYQELRIELAGYGEYGFILGSERQSEAEYIKDREKLTESIEKVQSDIDRMQYLIDNIESCYEISISGYAMSDSFGEELELWKNYGKVNRKILNNKMINKDSDAAYQSAVNAALENARKASKAADAAWDDYEDTLNSPNHGIWEAARDAYDVAYDAADAAWENARNVVNRNIGK